MATSEFDTYIDGLKAASEKFAPIVNSQRLEDYYNQMQQMWVQGSQLYTAQDFPHAYVYLRRFALYALQEMPKHSYYRKKQYAKRMAWSTKTADDAMTKCEDCKAQIKAQIEAEHARTAGGAGGGGGADVPEWASAIPEAPGGIPGRGGGGGGGGGGGSGGGGGGFAAGIPEAPTTMPGLNPGGIYIPAAATCRGTVPDHISVGAFDIPSAPMGGGDGAVDDLASRLAALHGGGGGGGGGGAGGVHPSESKYSGTFTDDYPEKNDGGFTVVAAATVVPPPDYGGGVGNFVTPVGATPVGATAFPAASAPPPSYGNSASLLSKNDAFAALGFGGGGGAGGGGGGGASSASLGPPPSANAASQASMYGAVGKGSWMTQPTPASAQPTPESATHSVVKGGHGKLERETSFKKGELRPITIPWNIVDSFLRIAHSNSSRPPNGVETCGILCGNANKRGLQMTHLIIPKQESTSDTVAMTHEEELFMVCLDKNLIVLGWIHTHPSQSCFMSSVDVHTHCGFQTQMDEAIAIVLAPNDRTKSVGTFRICHPDPPGLKVIQNCPHRGFHQHDCGFEVYREATHVKYTDGGSYETIDLRRT